MALPAVIYCMIRGHFGHLDHLLGKDMKILLMYLERHLRSPGSPALCSSFPLNTVDGSIKSYLNSHLEPALKNVLTRAQMKKEIWRLYF